MADHGKIEYATAEGNDYPAHESTYESFVLFALVGTIFAINIILGLATSTLTPHWLIGVLLTFVLAPAALIRGLSTRSPNFSYIALVLALIIFGLSTLSGGAGH